MATTKFAVCNRCGSVYPADYFSEWGRKYGHGLGSSPVCEALDSRYDVPPVAPALEPSRAMHPVGNCGGTLSIQELSADTEVNILAVDDPYMTRRAKVMQDIQRTKSHALDTALKFLEQ